MSIAARAVVPLTRGRAELFGQSDEAHRLLLDNVMRGLADIAAGRTEGADSAIARLQQRLAHGPQR